MSEKYHNKSQAALAAVMSELMSDGFPELSLAEVTERTGLTTDTSFRTLYNAQQFGWIEKLPGERYRLSQFWPKLGYRYFERLVEERNALHQRIQEFRA